MLSGCLLAGLVIVLSGHVRLGGIALAASLVGAGVLRLVLPQARLGGLAVRSRSADVVALVIGPTPPGFGDTQPATS